TSWGERTCTSAIFGSAMNTLAAGRSRRTSVPLLADTVSASCGIWMDAFCAEAGAADTPSARAPRESPPNERAARAAVRRERLARMLLCSSLGHGGLIAPNDNHHLRARRRGPPAAGAARAAGGRAAGETAHLGCGGESGGVINRYGGYDFVVLANAVA